MNLQNERIRFRKSFARVVALSIVFTMFIAFTPSATFNPLTIIMLIGCEFLPEAPMYFVGGMVISSAWTCFIANRVLNWKEGRIWLMSFAVSFFVYIGILALLFYYDIQLINIPTISEYVYLVFLLQYLSAVICFSFSQLLLLMTYYILSAITQKLKHKD